MTTPQKVGICALHLLTLCVPLLFLRLYHSTAGLSKGRVTEISARITEENQTEILNKTQTVCINETMPITNLEAIKQELCIEIEGMESDKFGFDEYYEETHRACVERKYLLKDKSINIPDPKRCMEAYNDPQGDSKKPRAYKTKFSVKNDDVLNVLTELKDEDSSGKSIPCALNLANPDYACLYQVAKNTQEEGLFRCTDIGPRILDAHFKALQKQEKGLYPMEGHRREGGAECEGLYLPSAVILRKNDGKEFPWLNEPKEVAFIVAGAYRNHLDRAKHEDLWCIRIRRMLRQMYLNKHKDIVLGAWGCGLFCNPPQLIANCFKKVFEEEEFKCRFEKVVFAILERPDNPGDKRNSGPFKKACTSLSHSSEDYFNQREIGV